MAESTGRKAPQLYLAAVQAGTYPLVYPEAVHQAMGEEAIGVRMRCPSRKRVQPRNRMRENRTSGTVSGALGDRGSYGERRHYL